MPVRAALGFLERGDPLLAVYGCASHFVKFGRHAGLDDSALPYRQRRALHDGLKHRFHERFEPFERHSRFGQRCARRGGKELDYPGKHRQRLCERGNVAGIGALVRDPADQALDVGDLPEEQFRLALDKHVGLEPGHAVEPLGNRPDVPQRVGDPCAQQPRAHGGARLVEHPQERAVLVVGVHGAEQLEVAYR